MSVIAEVRREREDLARVLKKHTGIRKIVEDLYPDSAHFIYELLQNAEDAKDEAGNGATEASFILSKTGLVFEHNGRSFDEQDIYAITDIGEGTKTNDDDKIGRFGVGFKAVFSYSETPHIWSPTFSFKIDELVLPSPLDSKRDLGNKTRFEFPFNNPKKGRNDAYLEVETALNELAETTLLFLSHLGSIRWQIGQVTSGAVLRIRHSDNHFEVLKQVDGKTNTRSHFLKFSQSVEGLEKQSIAVAFALDFLPNVQQFDDKKPLAKQFKIVSETPGQVAVFFPAEKEKSGLRFHLHAPFVPELSRASIKDTPANESLFRQLAELMAPSLDTIRDLGLLTAEFLAVLPNPQDPLPARYEHIRSSVVKEMNNRPLTPTSAKSHAPARHLLQARASLKELLSKEDLEFLVDWDDEPPQWAISAAQKNSNADRFLSSLDIKPWDIDEFITLVSERTSTRRRFISEQPYVVFSPDQEFMSWLSKKTGEWHQQFYAFLYKELQAEGGLYRLRNSQIVRLSDGKYSIGGKCFFPGDGVEKDEVLPRVDADVYTYGKSKAQQLNAKKLLEELEVREVGEAEQVEAILKQRYTEEVEIPDEKTYRKDLRRFVALVEKESDKAALFEDYFIFYCEGDQWCQPSGVFLDKPFLDTGLTPYFDALGEDAERFALAECYQDCGVSTKRLAKYAEAVGAETQLTITTTYCYSNPQWLYLSSVGGERYTSSSVDRDFVIEGLEELLETRSLNLSKLIWRTMALLPGDGRYMTAMYRKNASSGSRQADSQLVHHLRQAEWVPQSDGSFVRPADASRDLLPEGFPFDPGWQWLKAIHFGEEIIKRSEEYRQKQAAAQEMGFPDKQALLDGQWFGSLSLEQRQEYRENFERRQQVELPEREPANPDRRAEHVGAQAADAPGRETEERTRSVSVSREAVKEEAAQYLRQQYTDNDGELICQMCMGPLPFKLDDGTSYFEKVEFLPELKKRHYQNYLALCPNHAAMFLYANDSAELMREMFVDLTGNKLEIVLAQKDAAIYFTRTHIADLGTVIESEAQQLQDSDNEADPSDDGGGE